MSKNAGTSSPRRRKSSSADAAADARALAATVLARVWREDAWAAPVLDAEIARVPQLDPREARLATELVYGVLRTGPWLEQRIARHATNDRWRRNPVVRAHMLIAAYSLAFLERVPGFAAVDRAVGAVVAQAGVKVGGFANAVLRKLARDETRRDELSAAIEQSLPAWLASALANALGRDDARAMFTAGPVPPPLAICLRAGEDRAAWIAQLSAAAPTAVVEPGRLSPRCILLSGAGDHKKLPGASQAWIVQEEGAQLAALALGARPGETVLDACAGRGGKASLLADEVAPGGAVDAADLHPNKLSRLRASPAGARVREVFAVDWTKGSGGIDRLYDRIMVDAPCSGVGTLRRRPEIAARLSASDLTRLSALQTAIVLRASEHLRDGGRLVYAVCSVLREEAEDVVAAIVAAGGPVRLEPVPFEGPAMRAVAGDATALRLLPQRHGTDGYFVASFVGRRGDAS